MTLADIGEFGLIHRIAPQFIKPLSGESLGIGDDCAVVPLIGDPCLLVTTDMLIEDIHFLRNSIGPRELGHKSLAVNLSDIAAMGGNPEYALVSLALPLDTDVQSVTEMYSGMLEMASRYGVAIAGGNVSSAPQVMLSITVMGTSMGPLLTRSAALPGDMVAVTGWLGSSAAGLGVLKGDVRVSEEAAQVLKTAHLRPRPRVAEAQTLVRSGIRTAIDISDGLLSDLQRICEASQVRATIQLDRLPIHESVEKAFGADSARLALSGGEDYELLFTASSDLVERVKAELGISVTVVGEIASGDETAVDVIDAGGNVVDVGTGGWDHFAIDK
jgi:thiamine-monophosphate kinase